MKHNKFLTLLCLLIGLAVLMPTGNVSADTINGTLSSSSAQSHARPGRYADYYTIAGSGSAGSIVIIEVNPGTPDYIEFMNVGSASVDVSGWKIDFYDIDTWPAPKSLTIPSGSICAPGDVFTLEEEGVKPGVFPNLFFGANIDWTTDPTWVAAVMLRNSTGAVMDFFCAEQAYPYQISSPTAVTTSQWTGAPVAAPANSFDAWVRTGNSDHNSAADWTEAPPGFGTVYSGLVVPFTVVSADAGAKASIQMTGLNSYLYLYQVMSANGSISPDTAQTVIQSGSTTFMATPNLGYAVNQWLLNNKVVQTGGTSYTVSNVNADEAIQVTFKSGATKKVTTSAGTYGNINPNGAQIVNQGSNLVFTAVPTIGYVVDQWQVNGVAVQTGGTSYSLNNITANKTVNVTFKFGGVNTYSVTPSALNSGASLGTISPSTVQTVISGGSANFIATPTYGFIVDKWLVNSIPVQTGSTTFTAKNITANITVQVTFKPGQTSYQVNSTSDLGVNISPFGTETVPSSDSISFTAAPLPGYVIQQWLVNSGTLMLSSSGTVVVGGSGTIFTGTTYTLPEVMANMTVEVDSLAGGTTYNVTQSVIDSSGSSSTTGTVTSMSSSGWSNMTTLNKGDNVIFTVAPSPGYVVGWWLVNSIWVQTGGTTFTINSLAQNSNVQVVLQQTPTFTVTPSADTNNVGQLKLVQSNDNATGLSGGSLLSGVDLAGKQYYIEATTWGPGVTGTYTLSSFGALLTPATDPWTTSVNGAGWAAATTGTSGTISTSSIAVINDNLSSSSAPSYQRKGRYANYYSLTATKAGATTIQVTGINSYIYLYNSSFKLIASNDNATGLNGGSLLVQNMALGGVYYLEVTSWGPGVTGSYTLDVFPTLAPFNPAASGGTVLPINSPWVY